MFYRRKVILSLLQSLGGELSKTDFQKHLFLLTRLQDAPSYDFVPHHYGCFSFGADADRGPLIRAGLLDDTDHWKMKTRADFVAELKASDQSAVQRHRARYGHLRKQALIREVYTSYPYYAIRSRIAPDILSEPEMGVYTIGYEGLSLEAYLNRLLQNDVAVLCDVRKNPISRKYGFSKRQLRGAVEGLGMRYIHIPELGIVSGKRKDLDTPSAYNRLFDEYERDTLPGCENELLSLGKLVREHKRVALTCFEACHTRCHRSRVANALQRLPEWDYAVKHI